MHYNDNKILKSSKVTARSKSHQKITIANKSNQILDLSGVLSNSDLASGELTCIIHQTVIRIMFARCQMRQLRFVRSVHTFHVGLVLMNGGEAGRVGSTLRMHGAQTGVEICRFCVRTRPIWIMDELLAGMQEIYRSNSYLS